MVKEKEVCKGKTLSVIPGFVHCGVMLCTTFDDKERATGKYRKWSVDIEVRGPYVHPDTKQP